MKDIPDYQSDEEETLPPSEDYLGGSLSDDDDSEEDVSALPKDPNLMNSRSKRRSLKMQGAPVAPSSSTKKPRSPEVAPFGLFTPS